MAALTVPDRRSKSVPLKVIKVKLYKTLWGAVGSDAPCATFSEAVPRIAAEGWDGVAFALIAFEFEPDIGDLDGLAQLCGAHDLGLALMVHTFGDSVSDHLDYLGRELGLVATVEPHHVICHGGADSWGPELAETFYGRALELEDNLGLKVAHETHRSRLLHSPWQTTEILERFPELSVALDLSHWVVMGERLVHDQLEAIELAASRAIHLDARVGHEQAPQVPDPRDPMWSEHLAAFESWWDLAATGDQVIVPEYGPPPYLPVEPYTGAPVADLWDICDWAKVRLRDRYGA
ncbi:MAG: sugar phosphate isomerase/epimerase family protein, partial [Acidimicrobiales bacterium]